MAAEIDVAFAHLREMLQYLESPIESIVRVRGDMTPDDGSHVDDVKALYMESRMAFQTLLSTVNQQPPNVVMVQMEELHVRLKQIYEAAKELEPLVQKLNSEMGPSVMEAIQSEDKSQHVSILCRLCATPTQSNESMMCTSCLKDNLEIGEDIPRKLAVTSCRHCQRWQKAATIWAKADLESKELMAMLLKKIKGINKVKVENCKYLWTEPNSQRVMLQLTIRDTVENCLLEKDLIITFHVIQGICAECERSFTPHSWKAIVAIRQKSDNKRTLRHLEETIRSSDRQNSVVSVETKKDGFDLAFGKPQDAQSFVNFCRKFFVLRHSTSEQLISHDANNNTANKKVCHVINLAPISKGDLVFLPKKFINHYGNPPQLMVVTKVTTNITLMDPFTMRAVDVSSEMYWKYPFEVVGTEGHLTRFVVLDVEELPLSKAVLQQNNSRYYEGGRGVGRTDKETAALSIATSRFKPDELSFSKYRLAELEVAREADLGKNDLRQRVPCHLGLHVKPGDVVVGYDMEVAVIPGFFEEEAIKALDRLPSKVFLTKIQERAKGDHKQGPHNAMSSRFRVEAMREQVRRSKKELNEEDHDQDLDGFDENELIDMMHSMNV